MPNSLLTPSVIANELLMRFKNNLGFAKNVTNEYDEKFDKIGDTYNLRVPNRFVANDGADITSQIQDVTEDKIPLVINKQKNVAFKFSGKDLKLTVDRFAERYLQSASISLCNQFESDGLAVAVNATANLVGTPGTVPATALVVLQAGQKLDENSCPMDGDRYLTVNPAAQAAVVDGLKGLFQSSEKIGQQYSRGRMGTALGFEWNMAQNIPVNTVGTWGASPVVATTSTSGDTTLAISGLTNTTGTVKAGNVFTIAGVNAVNPITGADLGYLKQWEAAADATASGTGTATLTLTEAIINSGAKKNCTALPTSTAAIVKVGTASTSYAQNLAYHRHAFAFAMVTPEVPGGVHFASAKTDKETGIGIRIASQWNVLTDEYITRADIMYGWVARRPQWACRVTA